jgi:GT2 family glycosyltransferase
MKRLNDMSRYFATFIMTYERPAILDHTIRKLLQQSMAPEKILIVDNSESFDTKHMVEGLKDQRIQYFRVGHNAGPAGAARIGLQKLAKEGFQWINWCDDDNPPEFQESFEELLREGDLLIGLGTKVGAVGISGNMFNKRSGELIRLKTNSLETMNEVDTIPGNVKLIIRNEVVSAGILPDERLFFGFEEFDFSLRIRKAGFRMFCHGPLMKKTRTLYGRKDRLENNIGRESTYQLRRRYYSYRNLLFILFHKEKLYFTSLLLSLKWLGRAALTMRFGISYFIEMNKVVFRSIRDGYTGRLGINQSLHKK